LEICHIADLLAQLLFPFRLLLFLKEHHFERFLFKLVEQIVLGRQGFVELRVLGLHDFTLVVGIWNNALWYHSLIISLVVKVFIGILLAWELEEVKRVKCIFHGCLPILVVEVIVNPHEFLVNKFGSEVLFLRVTLHLWQFHLLTYSGPIGLQPLVIFRLVALNSHLDIVERIVDHLFESAITLNMLVQKLFLGD